MVPQLAYPNPGKVELEVTWWASEIGAKLALTARPWNRFDPTNGPWYRLRPARGVWQRSERFLS